MSQQTQTDNSYQNIIAVTTDKVRTFNALTIEIDQWWAPVDQTAEHAGDIFKITFDEDSYWKFEVVDLARYTNITWECIASHQDHNLEGMDEEWLGTRLHWEIREEQGKVEIKFLHQGLMPKGVCYDVCSSAWDFYITDSLKRYLEEGAGKPDER